MSDPVVGGWSSLIGHERIRDGFAAAIAQGRLGGSFLLVGPNGTGKHTIARLLAQTLLCETSPPADMAPCGACPSCRQVVAGSHPDVVRVGKPDDKTVIPLSLLIGEPDVRMQEGFCHDVRIKPLMGRRKVAILDDADYLNEEGANCLLKTLEEPPSGTVILLIGSSEQRQLPTIRSRCQTIRVGPLPVDAAIRLLREVHSVQGDDERLRDAIEISGGDMHVAIRLLEGESDRLRQSWLSRLDGPQPDPIAIGKFVTQHLADVGKEPMKRRAAMRDLFSISVQHFRRQLRREALGGRSDRKTLARLDRSMRALRELERSANQASLSECFAADIANGTTGDRGEIG